MTNMQKNFFAIAMVLACSPVVFVVAIWLALVAFWCCVNLGQFAEGQALLPLTYIGPHYLDALVRGLVG